MRDTSGPFSELREEPICGSSGSSASCCGCHSGDRARNQKHHFRHRSRRAGRHTRRHVKVVNTATGVTQTLVTNSSGYFEARLLIAGDYEVVIEMEGFKTLRRSGISLGSGQQLALQLPLEIGAIAEEITVTGEAPLLETTTLRQGLVLDEKKIVELPIQSNMAVLFARFAPGMQARGVIPFAGQGFVGGPTTNATPLGGVGGVDWSIDGATNNGVGRQMSTSPNTDMLQEMRVESTNFTASIGHGTGVGITMMTRAGTNTPRGTLNHQYWTNKYNPPNRFQDAIFDADPRARTAYEEGYSHNASMTFGGPVQIPGSSTARTNCSCSRTIPTDTTISTASQPPIGPFRGAIRDTTSWLAIFPTYCCCLIPLST